MLQLIERSSNVSGNRPIIAIAAGAQLEFARLVIVADGAQYGTALSVTGVEDPSQFVVLFEKCVGLIDQQRRLGHLDHPKNCRHRGIRGGERSRHETRCHIQQCGFSTSLFRACDRNRGECIKQSKQCV